MSTDFFSSFFLDGSSPSTFIVRLLLLASLPGFSAIGATLLYFSIFRISSSSISFLASSSCFTAYVSSPPFRSVSIDGSTMALFVLLMFIVDSIISLLGLRFSTYGTISIYEPVSFFGPSFLAISVVPTLLALTFPLVLGFKLNCLPSSSKDIYESWR
jgi:hypothetical protein